MPTGAVKFFNTTKGFGFISPEDGGADVFVHVSAVERSGLSGLREGDRVSYQVEQDRRSGKLAAVDLQVIGSSGAAPRPAPRSGGFAPRPSQGGGGGGGGAGAGTVKWFNTTKGYGFIQPDDGGADVFVHISALEQAGLRTLQEGQRVNFDVEQDRRSGKTSAVNLEVLG